MISECMPALRASCVALALAGCVPYAGGYAPTPYYGSNVYPAEVGFPGYGPQPNPYDGYDGPRYGAAYTGQYGDQRQVYRQQQGYNQALLGQQRQQNQIVLQQQQYNNAVVAQQNAYNQALLARQRAERGF